MRGATEIKALTGLRGIAALYVVIYHYTIGLTFSNPATIAIAHGYLAVDLFFVLSGFVMALNYAHMFGKGFLVGAYLKFLGRRIARIYPLYLMMTILAFLLVSLGYLEGPTSTTAPTAFLMNIIMVQTWGLTESLDPPGWSISAEWAAYMLFPAIAYAALFRSPRWAFGFGGLCVVILVALCLIPQPWVRRPTDATLLDIHRSNLAMPVWRCLPEFALGVLAFRLHTSRFGTLFAERRWIAPVAFLLAIVLLAVPQADVFIVMLFPLLILSLAAYRSAPAWLFASMPAMFFGELSYSIYLTHDLFGGLLSWVHHLAETHGLGHAQTYAAVVGLLLTFPCAYLAHRFIEVPGRRGLRHLFEGRRAADLFTQRVSGG